MSGPILKNRLGKPSSAKSRDFLAQSDIRKSRHQHGPNFNRHYKNEVGFERLVSTKIIHQNGIYPHENLLDGMSDEEALALATTGRDHHLALNSRSQSYMINLKRDHQLLRMNSELSTLDFVYLSSDPLLLELDIYDA